MKCPSHCLLRGAVAAAVLVCAALASPADDWPTYMHDHTRSGVTAEALKLPLHEQWVFKPRHAPCPAWPAAAPNDYWHGLRELKPVVTYDRASHAVSAGDCVYFSSSADDQVYCVDAASGEVRWTFYTEGPVRLAPTIYEGKAYFGSDDGRIYCVDAAEGTLVWAFEPGEGARRIPGNGRVISSVPARTGVLVDKGVAYCYAGLFPSNQVYQCALDAETGEPLWHEKTGKLSPQGYLLATSTRLFVPTGRTNPAMIDRASGDFLGELAGNGGAYAVVVGDAVATGPGRRTGNELALDDSGTRESVATFPGIRMVVSGDIVYLQSKEKLSALNRTRYVDLYGQRSREQAQLDELNKALKAVKGKDEAEAGRLAGQVAEKEQAVAKLSEEMAGCFLWEKFMADPYALILAGDTLFAGGEDKVRAINAADGTEVWAEPVTGRVYGLSVANGRLFASTSEGTVHCFATPLVDRENVVVLPDEPEPYGEDKLTAAYAATADAILAKGGVAKGYCIVLGCGEGRLAYELAKRSELKIVGVERDEKAVAEARRRLDAAGLYGNRITIMHWEDDALPFTTYMANLVVSEEALVEGKLSTPATEALRVTRPFGGVVCIGRPDAKGLRGRMKAGEVTAWMEEGMMRNAEVSEEGGVWAVYRRGPLEGTGEWTQLYADASHTACSMDPVRDPMTVQWFGEPGPREIVDRHHRPMSSLFKQGRVFVPANDKVLALDAYNGTLLWELDVPNSRRIGVMKNCGQMLVEEDYLYIAVEGTCWAVNVATGEREFVLDVPGRGDEPQDWGYLNCVGDQLFGTGQAVGASFDQLTWDTCGLLEGDHRPVIMSRYVFSVDRYTGKKKWIYRKGAILNAVMAVADGRLYFVESRNEKTMENEEGRTRLKPFLASETYLVALDLEKGKKVWEQPFTFPFEHIMFANGAKDTLVVSGTYNKGPEVYYELYGFDMKTGKLRWDTPYRALDIRGNEFCSTGGSHGEQWQHPVLVTREDGEVTVFSRPFAFDLATGAKLEYVNYRGGHGCGGLTGSAYYLYGRGDNPRMYPIETAKTSGLALTRVSRPGCWLNIIPAGGLILIPESSSGCTCAYPLQTSIALIPEAICGPVS